MFKVSDGLVSGHERNISSKSAFSQPSKKVVDDSSDDDIQIFNDAKSDDPHSTNVVAPQASLDIQIDNPASSALQELIHDERAINDSIVVDNENDSRNNNQPSIALDRPRRTRRPPQRLLDEMLNQQHP